ncbi:hypothetical protein ACFOWA_16370 [Pedobacter lithocola]|uniref:Uncharacterized protein n=1 Tax=Pedobacter lithocola TaxID=1908239 RepID=A0ABV8PEP4_9SPHI
MVGKGATFIGKKRRKEEIGRDGRRKKEVKWRYVKWKMEEIWKMDDGDQYLDDGVHYIQHVSAINHFPSTIFHHKPSYLPVLFGRE